MWTVGTPRGINVRKTQSTNGPPKGASWTQDIARASIIGLDNIVGIEIFAEEYDRIDVMIGAANENVQTVLSIVQEVRTLPIGQKTEPRWVSVLRYSAVIDQKDNILRVECYMKNREKLEGPWVVLPIIRLSSWALGEKVLR